MALPSSGSLDMATIRNYYLSFGYGGGAYDLNSYRGLPKSIGWSCYCLIPSEGGPQWICNAVVTSSLPTGTISFSDFYGANLDPGTAPTPPIDSPCYSGGGGGP